MNLFCVPELENQIEALNLISDDEIEVLTEDVTIARDVAVIIDDFDHPVLKKYFSQCRILMPVYRTGGRVVELVEVDLVPFDVTETDED